MNDVFLDEVIRPADGEQRQRARRPGREDRNRRRRQRRRRSALALIIALGLLGGGAWAVVAFVMPVLEGFSFGQTETEAADFPGPGAGSVQVVIPAGATGSAMAAILHEAEVVASERAFTRAFAANAQAAEIQPGTYDLLLGMKASDAVQALLNRDNKVETRVTIVESRTVEQILDRISSVTTVPIEDLEAAMEDTEATGLPAEAEGNYEGWLFPATYSWEPGTTPSEMISDMVSQTIRVLDERGVAPEDRKAVLTKASLVERESPDAEASPLMARAIENRLEQGMRLQIDAAVAYGLGKSGMELTRADIAPTATDNPYNTYAHTGLPPTPIAAPGLASIDAVLDPADGPWLFWVTINLDTKETLFAETYEEHLRNEQLLRQWQREQG